MKITARIREAIELRRKRRKILARSRASQEELVVAIDDFELDAKRKRQRLRDLVRNGRRPERQEELADQIEEIEGALDVLYERLDDRRDKTDKARARLVSAEKRIKRLKERRRRIEASRGDLTTNFSMPEFDCREGDPVPDYMEGPLRGLCTQVLEKMRDRFGSAHINSGHRWRFYNQKIGGALNSYHEYEYRKSQPAADCTFASGTPSQWAAYARQLGVGGVGQYSTFVHVDTGPRRDWWG